jgi:hypothetical protein
VEGEGAEALGGGAGRFVRRSRRLRRRAEAGSAPARSPSEESTPASTVAPGVTPTSPAAPPPPPTTTQFAPPPNDLAWSNLVQAEQALDANGSDCANACRALGSMDRATGVLCGAADTPGEHARCEDAKGRLLRARDRVRASCGGCPGGPSVEHDAAIPSLP